ncbi:Hypothetical protein DHA2_152409 [Giardia duodenalis]|uniref:Uncharacterized protein n=1 Tax=Giardia intestinalis TaxID=5741 RepID=V6TAH3_GIAIN|nr:Hypothetical protein DHA2_152409 [Giardia intestinalis]
MPSKFKMDDLQNSYTKSPPSANRSIRRQPNASLHLSSAPMTMSLKHEIRLPVLTRAYTIRLQEEAMRRIKNGFVSLQKLRREPPYRNTKQQLASSGAISISDIVTSLTQDLLDEFITRVCSEVTISMDRLLVEMGIKNGPPHLSGAIPLTETLTASMLNSTATLSGPGLSLHQGPSRITQKAYPHHKVPARSK